MLLRAKLGAGAYYLAGYAVECGLKACIAKNTRRHEFPDKQTVNDSYTHDLGKLVRVAKLQASLDHEAAASADFAACWFLVRDWGEESRYEPTIDEQRARDLYRAIANPRFGVMRWVRNHW